MRANHTRAPFSARQALLLGTPLAGMVLALFRPEISGPPPSIFSQVQAHATFWVALHLLLLPFFGLLALAGFQLTTGSTRRAASLSRWALAVFAVLAIALDGVLGLGIGLLAGYANGQPAVARSATAPLLDALWSSHVLLALAALAALAWWLALTALVVALTHPTISWQFLFSICVLSAALFANGQIEGPNRLLWWVGLLAVVGGFAYAAEPRALAGLLAASALLFSSGLVAPYGPLGLLCFLAAAMLVVVPAASAWLAPPPPPSPATASTRTARKARD